MKTRLNKKNETVTITLNADELWTLRSALFNTWNFYFERKAYHLAEECITMKDGTDKAFDYLSREWGK